MRLIDADEMAIVESEAYMKVNTRADIGVINQALNSVVHRKIQQLIADTPAVDAVPVVRCRDCKYFYRDAENNRAWCNYNEWALETAVNGYCFRGERRDNG